jgi:site-specific DNA-methyltransferase (adenine-specific)/modification methylase
MGQGGKGMKTVILAEGRITLIHGNAPTLAADAIVTDPPYGIKYKSGANSGKSISTVGKRFTRPVTGDKTYFDPRWLFSYPQVALTGAQYLYKHLPVGGMIHCWDKRGNYKPLDQADADLIWIKRPSRSAKRSRVFHLVWRGICRHAEHRERILHPTQKPIALMEWMLDLCTLAPGSLVYDPYMGVGTTALACLNRGLTFVGSEIEQEYFNLAITRIERYLYESETQEGSQRVARRA